LTAYLSSLRRSERTRRRAAKKRDELAPLQLIELHPLPHEPGGHGRISNWQGSSAGRPAISQPNGCWTKVCPIDFAS
jgi:hypothetical protein